MEYGIDFSGLEEDEEDDAQVAGKLLDPRTFQEFVSKASSNLYHAGAASSQDKMPAARLNYNKLIGQGVWLDVEVDPPFKVLDASPTVIEMFGFNEQEIVGRNLRMLQGPLTNTAELTRAIQGCSNGESVQRMVVLYNKEGEERVVSVGFRLEEVPNSDKKKCVALIEHGDWVPKKIADAEDGRSKVVVSSEKPYSIASMSSKFRVLFGGLEEDKIVGRSLSVLFGPRTDMQKLDRSMQAAKSARTQNLSLLACTRDAQELLVDLIIYPVLVNGVISHFMLVMRRAAGVSG
mmetsp:Transcript_32096/g.72101  ORF Transcript_32096/g.72101 Transcript_32096/m.72101 type:complete len:291 (-) Transcript_32096:20-892(-)